MNLHVQKRAPAWKKYTSSSCSCSFGFCQNYLDPNTPPPNLDNLYHFLNTNVPKNLGRGLPLPPSPQIDPIYTVCEKWTKNLGRALPPSFGQNPKEQLLFFGRPSLRLFLHCVIYHLECFVRKLANRIWISKPFLSDPSWDSQHILVLNYTTISFFGILSQNFFWYDSIVACASSKKSSATPSGLP